MTTPTPAAAPAAPAAVAPVPAPAAPAPAPAAPAPAPAVPAPAAPTPAPAAPAPAPGTQTATIVSLLDGGTPTPAPAPAAPAPTTVHPEWFLAPEVKGAGAAPDWFKADKYKTVHDQAKAYVDLERRFGAFTGAPDGGKYEFKMPEGITGEMDVEHPIYVGFNKWAAEHELNQEGYNDLLGMFVTYEAGLAPNMAEIKAELGENADARITAANTWARANLKDSQYEQFRVATSGGNAAAVFSVIESVIGMTRQVVLPKPGDDIGGNAHVTAAVALKTAREMKDPKTGEYLILMSTSEGQKHRHKVAEMEFALAKAQEKQGAAA